MFDISYSFDEELGPNGIDPLGNLRISDGEATIVIETTFLDSGFAGLVEAVEEIETKNHFSLEIEEPKKLAFDVTADGEVVVSYSDRRVVAQTKEALQTALKKAACSFLHVMAGLPDSHRNQILDPIVRFCEVGRN